MTTVTIVVGNKNSGKRLVGTAIAAWIRNNEGKKTLAVDRSWGLKPESFKDVDDLILISDSDHQEEWMKPWLAVFGQPLFTVNILRHSS